MHVVESATYRDYVSHRLDPKASGRRGLKTALATHLRCHPTLISQICTGRADFSIDQAIGFCQYFSLSLEDTDSFIDLLQHDRAATPAARRFFAARVNARKKAFLEPRTRLQINSRLAEEHAHIYYRTWLPQAIHILCQTRGTHTTATIAQRLGVCQILADEVVRQLVSIGTLKQTQGGSLTSQIDTVHADNTSSLIKMIHQNWRLKTTHDLQNSAGIPGTHFSAVVSVPANIDSAIQQRIAALIEDIGKLVQDPKTDEVHSLCIDFYRIDRPPNSR